MNVKKLNELIQEGINATIQRKMAEDLIDSIAETMEEKLEISKAGAKQRIAAAYEKQYNTEKYLEKREKIEGLYSDLDAVEVK